MNLNPFSKWTALFESWLVNWKRHSEKRQNNKPSFKAIIYENLIPLSAQVFNNVVEKNKELNKIHDSGKVSHKCTKYADIVSQFGLWVANHLGEQQWQKKFMQKLLEFV